MHAILIAFTYHDSVSVSLPSSIVDAYRASAFYKGIKQYILSDWVPTPIRRAKPCKLDDGWHSFITGSDQNISWYKVSCKKSFIDAMKKIDNIEGNGIVYYSGHGKTNGWIEFPDGSEFQHTMFCNILLNKFSSRSQICMIIDCCSAGNFGFPFTLVNTHFKIKEKSCMETAVNKNVICITSTQADEDSIANNKYSYFTKYLFRVLSTKEIRLDHIISLIAEKLLIRTFQRVGIHSSYNRIPVLWNWCHGMDVQFNIHRRYICIKRSKYKENETACVYSIACSPKGENTTSYIKISL